MLNIISVGINHAIPDLTCPCASTDAMKIYEAFAETCSKTFSTYNSLSLADIKSNEFIDIIEVTKHTVNKDDIFVIYFSGHGTLSNDKLYLHFSNEQLAMEKIKASLDECLGHVVIILDCCYAGGALSLANRQGLFNTSHLSVIASKDFETSKFDECGSKFTRYFIWAIRNLYIHIKELTLNSIVKKITDLGYCGCQINIEEGLPDLTLCKYLDNKFDSMMIDKFVDKLNLSNYELRETLFYTINKYSPIISFNSIKKYLHSRSELSWLVRRVIGSYLSLLVDDKEVFDYCLYQLKNNKDWTVKIIFAIALRYKLTESEVKSAFLDLLSQDTTRIDLVWLLMLYLSEKPDKVLCQILKQTKLMCSDWGKLEIIKALKLIECSNGFSIDDFFNKDDLSPSINNYINFKRNFQEGYKNSTELIKVFYDSNYRGRLPENSQNKQLLSILFGYYRYNVNADLTSYFESFNFDFIFNELKKAKDFPLVEMRMEIFTFFKNNVDLFLKFQEAVTWGLEDIHPWVRREAVTVFAPYNLLLCKEKLNLNYDNLYPGYFDLILALMKYGINLINEDKSYMSSLSKLENVSLELELKAYGIY